ncbi:MAG: ATP-dependent dethiobiotin synthetase BioD [Candidatus Delongbacteria bacterium]|nr:ATP-dependent dethiobiotin synthetase BioD [Candidatus Delongbacteria bacterium]
MSILFITGIDTGIGKTYITGLIARSFLKSNRSVITQKLAQTGCDGISEDIITHRKIMGIDLVEEDRDFTTCNYVFKFPASPHLSAELENRSIDVNKIIESTEKLAVKYDNVLIEGVGGLFVPLTPDYLSIDFIKDQKYPVILVTSSRLGSINHTLMSIEALNLRNIQIKSIVYIRLKNEDTIIGNDTLKVIKNYLSTNRLDHTQILEVPEFDLNSIPDIDFNGIFY